MATKLKNLKIKKVDFVDNGANPGASIALYKSKPAEGETPAVQPKEDTPPEESILKRIVHAIAKSIGATDAQVRLANALIGRLEPKPGRRFVDGERNIVVPEVLVVILR